MLPTAYWRLYVDSLALLQGLELAVELHPPDFLMQLDDAVDQRFGARRAARDIHVDRHDLVDALDDRIVIEHTGARGAVAHRDHPLWIAHLVVQAAYHRRHFARDAPGHDD